jgi:glycosyltransferase involved in cell wall biosynthesis
VDGIPDLIEDEKNGLLVSPADSDALANAIERLYLDEGLRRRLAEQAVKTAGNYLPSSLAERIVDEVYNRMSGSVSDKGN